MIQFRHLTLASLAALLPCIASADLSISSPDEQIQLHTDEEDGKLFYSVKFNGKVIISDSRLGVELASGAFAGDIELTSSSSNSEDEIWEPIWGQFSEYRNHYNELTLNLTETSETKRSMDVVIRAYDDGVAFRYLFSEQKGLENANFRNELSQVSLVSEAPVAWYAASSTTLRNDVPFSKIERPARTPFTVQVSDGCFVSLHEAAVVNSADAMLTLGADQRTLTYNCKMNAPASSMSPWRTILIAETPGELVESTLIMNLNEPSKLKGKDTAWIEPGVSLWDWRCHGGVADDGFVYGINTESYIRYIDFAYEHGLAYVLIDAEWYGPERDNKSDPVTYEHEIDMPRVTSYAREKGVGLWLYINDKALKGFDMDRTFSQYKEWGIRGIKHGFLGGGNQTKNAFSVRVIEKCAEYGIMYNLHEPNKPTGLTRTYPHYMSNEYVNSMLDAASRKPATPSELSVFPVVHNLGGPVDRSCGLFDMDQSISRDKVHKQIPSTVVSQVGQCLVFYSGILTLPDMPDAYSRKMDLFEFIKQLPMTWDDTKVLEMKIGDYITMARRSGNEWFTASLADESGREAQISLDFLEPGVTYEVTIYEDTADSNYEFSGGWNRKDAQKKKIPFKPVETNREHYQVRKIQAKKGDVVLADIAPGGGHCMWIRPLNHETN